MWHELRSIARKEVLNNTFRWVEVHLILLKCLGWKKGDRNYAGKNFKLWIVKPRQTPMSFHLMWIHTYIFHKLRLPFSWLQKQLSLICPVSLCGSPTKAKTSTAVNNAVAGKHPRGEFAGYHLLAFSTHFPPVLWSLLLKGPEALEMHYCQTPSHTSFR